VTKLQDDIENGPLSRTSRPQEIRRYLTSHYDFPKPLALDDVVADCRPHIYERGQVQVTHPVTSDLHPEL